MSSTPASAPAKRPVDRDEVARALRLFKIMALLEGIALLILIVVMVLKYGFHVKGVSEAWSPIHGFTFMVYAFSVGRLALAMRWGLGRMLLLWIAGCIPFYSFIAERRATDQVRAELGG